MVISAIVITKNVNYVYSVIGVPTVPVRPVIAMTTCTNAVIQWRRPAADNGQNIHHYYVRYRQVDQPADWAYIM